MIIVLCIALKNKLKISSIQNNYKSDLFPFAVIILMAAIIFFTFLGNFSLFNPDEGLYAEPAREMLETGEYITTTLNYVVRFTKPPLIIWAMALAYKILGINEFAARLFCASSGFILTIITYLFAKKYLDKQRAFFSACILLTAPLFIGVGRMAITDMPLSLFMAGSLFSFFHAWKQKNPAWLYLGYILTALAIMTKGPVAFILPALILPIFFLLADEGKPALKFFNLPLGLFIIGLIALPWFVIEIAATKGAYFQEFIMRENFARFTSVVDSHKGAWWYHIAAVFAGLFPWSILLPQATITAIKNISSTKDNKENQLLLFAIIWSVITVFFFSISVSKLLPYTLPAFPALAIIIANQIAIFIERKQQKNMLVYNIIMAFFYVTAAFLSPFALKYLRNSPPDLITLIFYYCALMAILMLISIIMIAYKRLNATILSAVMLINTAIFLPQFLSVVNSFWEGNIPRYAQIAKKSNRPLIVYGLRKPGIPFYFGQKVIQLNKKEDLEQTSNDLKQCYLITSNRRLPEVLPAGFKVIAHDTNFALLTLP